MFYNNMPTKKTPFISPKRLSKRLILGFSCLGFGFLAACANVIPPCGAKISPPSSELRNTKWELIRWNLPPNTNGEVRARQIPQGEKANPIQMAFDNKGEQLSGFAGCNRFTAQLNEDSRGFIFEKIATTKMSCNPARSELENDFLYELNDYRTIIRDGDRMLMIGNDREVLTFAQRSTGQQ